MSAIYKCDIKKLYNSNIQIFFCQLRPNANMKNFVNQTIRFVFLLAFQRCFCQSHNPPLSASLAVWRRPYRDLFLLFSLSMFIYDKYRWGIQWGSWNNSLNWRKVFKCLNFIWQTWYLKYKLFTWCFCPWVFWLLWKPKLFFWTFITTRISIFWQILSGNIAQN